MEESKTVLSHLSLYELEQQLSHIPRYRAKQIHKWIIKGADSFDKMTDIPLSLQNELKESFIPISSRIVSCHNDPPSKSENKITGDAIKAVIALRDESRIESVLLSDGKERYTACISTQAGCPAGCVFCKTGTLRFKRNLEVYEIVEQFSHLQNICSSVFGEERSQYEHVIGSIVVMGMGEPLLNLENLKKAISIFTDSQGINFSKRRITVSTCGICESLCDIAKNGPYIRLALSLVTSDEKLRERLVPISKSNPLSEIKKILLLFQENGGGRITLEVPLLGGINTREKDAVSIAEFADGLVTVINIIPWNPVAGLEFEGKPLREPERKEKMDFINMLEKRKLKVTTRFRKGRNVSGACGQLGSVSEK